MKSLKSHKSKMMAGELYLGSDSELVEDQYRAQDLVAKFNNSSARDETYRRQILTQLLAKFGKDTIVRPRISCDYGYNISFGERCFVNFDCVFLDCNTITIGDEVLLAPGVHIYTATHPLDPQTRRAGWESALPVVIESGVWIGGGAIICPGVTIGENSVIGAGSVITKNIPANVVAAGNPCRVIKPIANIEDRADIR